MAQTGYTPISLYYSTTASQAPTAGNLANGELAINITDGKLYYKDNTGTVKVIAGSGGTGIVAGSNTQIQFNNNGVFGASANLTWDGSFLTVASIKDSALTSGRVTYAGASGLLTDSANLTFNGTTLTAGGFTTTGTTSTGVLSVTGNTTLGTSTSNTVAVNALVNSNLLFVDGTYDIGASGATRPRNLYLAGNEVVAGSVTWSGGTANGIVYLNGSKVATTGSAYTFNGTTVTQNLGGGIQDTVMQSWQLGSSSYGEVQLRQYYTAGALYGALLGVGPTAQTDGVAGVYFTATAGVPSTGQTRLRANGVDYLSVSTSETVVNTGQAAYNFRVGGSGQANLLYVNGTSNYVGINTTTLISTLTVNGGIASTDGTRTVQLGTRTTTNGSLTAGTTLSSAGNYNLQFFADSANGTSGASVTTNVFNGSAWVQGIAVTNGTTPEVAINGNANAGNVRIGQNGNTYGLYMPGNASGVNINGYDTIQGLLNVINNTGNAVASTTSLYITTGNTYGTASQQKNLDLVFQGYRDGVGTGNGAKARIRAVEATGNNRLGTLTTSILNSSGNLVDVTYLDPTTFVVNPNNSSSINTLLKSANNSYMFYLSAATDQVYINGTEGSTTAPFVINVPTGVNTKYALDIQKQGGYGESFIGAYYTNVPDYGLAFTVGASGNVMKYNYSGNLTIPGALSKGSGSFRISHPLPALAETHDLVHSFVEAPQADLYYRGKIDLVNGRAEINIDVASGMTDGTFVLLCREVQCFTSNETDWDAVRGFVNGNILTIECQNTSSSATVSWLVVGERQDKHMYDTSWTDNNGKVIVEPLKASPVTE